MAYIKKIALIFLLFVGFESVAQKPDTRILFVLDASGSMYANMDHDTRIVVAKRLMTRLVDSLEDVKGLELALRIYGHQSPKNLRDCKDTKLEVPFGPTNHSQIKEEIRDIRPKGTTLIAYSLKEAAYDFPKDDGVRNVIILITDGIEECDGDPCSVSEALQRQGVVLRPFIIGLGLTEEFKLQFDCVGRFFEAATEDDFKNVLGVVINQAINSTSVQVNLLDEYGKPNETDVAISFTNSKTDKEIKTVMHTLNYRGNPDTMYIDPSYSYDMKVHTIPPVIKKNITLTPGIHNVIAVDAPQGVLKLQVNGVTNYAALQALIMDPKTGEIINVQPFNVSEKYITGEYDLEILTLPRITQKGVSIKQSKTTTLQVQQPGKLNLLARMPIVASIFQYKAGKLVLVTNVRQSGTQKTVVLQPGKYQLVYRKSALKESIKSKTLDFEIASGKVNFINIK